MITFEFEDWEIPLIAWIIITLAVFVGMWIVSDQISKDKSERSITYACGEYQEKEVKKMTKKNFIEAMKDLDDDAEVRVYCTSMDSDGGQYAHDIYFDDIVKGSDLQNEITIVAHF